MTVVDIENEGHCRVRLLDALTLTERLQTWQLQPSVVADAFDPDLADRRIAVWRSQSPFEDGELLRQRLADEGLDEITWHQLAGEHPEAVAERMDEEPRWVQTLTAAYTDPGPQSLPPLEGETGLPAHSLQFLHLAEPLIARGFAGLRDGLATLQAERGWLPFDPAAIESLLYAPLARRLGIMLARTLTLELHVASHRGLLQGNSPQARFEHFIERLADPQVALAILEEYPVLARQMVVAIDHWRDFSLELLTHLAEDWPLIGERFTADGDAGELATLRSGMGDAHRGGRSVVKLRTTTGLELVYKPRSLAVDAAFQDLLAWLDERGVEPGFRTLRVLDCGSHGYVEHVAPATCRSIDQLRRFYRRQGGYLALLYLLDATDFHHENLIAAGEHPVLVDLEALFHPAANAPHRPPGDSQRIAEPLHHSVLKIGLLPQRTWGNEDDAGMDVSGLAATGGQTVRDGSLSVEDEGTDRMRFVRQVLNLPGADNRPSLNGEDVDVSEYAGEVRAGFAALYRFLLNNRRELLAGPLAAFAEVDVRVLMRPTRAYAMLLGESFHPDFLRSAIDRDRFFDKLWVGVQERPYLRELVYHERRALERIDIPTFTSRPGSRDLWADSGARLPDFLGETGLERLERRFAQWDEPDLARQTWLIDTTLGSIRHFTAPLPAGYRLSSDGPTPSRQALIAAAGECVERLDRRAFREGNLAWWYDFELVGNDYWTLQIAGPTLYSGLPGIALFLAYFAEITGEARASELARAGVGAWRRMLANELRLSPGMFNGWGGGLYTLAHLEALWRDPELPELADSLLEHLDEAMDSDDMLDVIGGTAGAVLAVLVYHRVTGSKRALALAVRGGERLLRASRPAADGRAWVTPLAERPLAGFSHGAAGIAWTLLALWSVTEDSRFREAGLQGIAYERAIYAPDEGNWPDLRDGRESHFLVAWCHGAPGVGLARTLALDYIDDAATRREVEVAVETTLQRGMGMNLSLCHGDLGQLDILLQAAHKLGDRALEQRVYQLASSVLAAIDTQGWRCGIPRGAEPPGLMLGLAGVGLGWLRLAEPARVPSVLALAPPAV